MNLNNAQVAVAGAGVAGRLLACRLLDAGARVSLVDENPASDARSCSFAAAGMLSPLAEIEQGELTIAEFGRRSLTLWPQWLAWWGFEHCFRQRGSLVLAHGADRVELERFSGQLRRRLGQRADCLRTCAAAELEPDLAGFEHALFLPEEGQIDTHAVMAHLLEYFIDSGGQWRPATAVDEVEARQLSIAGAREDFDWVFDCRGLGARRSIPQLRGVRGELLWLWAPEVDISRPVRLMHPRYRIYLVPRSDGVYLLGATEIESESMRSVSVRSALELLSAAYTLNSGFGEAEILDFVVQCRPTTRDHLPYLHTEPGLTRINGLYRHGFLLAPAMVERALANFANQPRDGAGNLDPARVGTAACPGLHQ